MYQDREDAGRQLARMFAGRSLRDPLVLGVPRGGVVVAAVIAEALDADLDVVLARKVGLPTNPEFALAAVDEDGRVTLNNQLREAPPQFEQWIREESARQADSLRRRRREYCGERAPSAAAGRSVVVVDDGVATGATTAAALLTLRGSGAAEIILAVPVGAPDRLERLRHLCDDLVCPLQVQGLGAVGECYEDFEPVEDDVVIRLLHEAWARESKVQASLGRPLRQEGGFQ